MLSTPKQPAPLLGPRTFKRLEYTLVNGILSLTCLMMLFPIVYTVLTSFKPKGEVLTAPPSLLPITWTLDAYRSVWHSHMLRYYLPNTLINSVSSSVLVVLIAALASYTFSRYRFRGSKLLQLTILGVMMIPGLTNLIPQYRLASNLGLLSTNRAMIALYVGGGLPFSIWIIKSFFDSIPRELEEAALIDGCTPMQSLVRVILPLAVPGVFAAFLLNLVDTWNEFLAAVVMLTRVSSKTATVGLLDFQAQFEVAYNVQAAGCVIIMLPVILLFVLSHRLFFQAMLDGALKG